MTPLGISIAAAIASLVLLTVIFELIRRHRLRERYALLWLLAGIVLLVLSLWRGSVNTIAGWAGVRGYPPAVLFAVASLFILVVLLHYSTVISKLADQNAILAQRLALLEHDGQEENGCECGDDRHGPGSHLSSNGTALRRKTLMKIASRTFTM